LRQNLNMDIGNAFFIAMTLGGAIKNIDKSRILDWALQRLLRDLDEYDFDEVYEGVRSVYAYHGEDSYQRRNYTVDKELWTAISQKAEELQVSKRSLVEAAIDKLARDWWGNDYHKLYITDVLE